MVPHSINDPKRFRRGAWLGDQEHGAFGCMMRMRIFGAHILHHFKSLFLCGVYGVLLATTSLCHSRSSSSSAAACRTRKIRAVDSAYIFS